MESRKSTSKEILCRDERIWVAYGQQERSVFAKQILPDGRLLIENEQHEEEILPCGDVSLRIRRM